ncbi:MAG: hypothetical protein JXQ65_05925 [Candidatus Marinimicrobia bacterium]|nr:hypothetical protein [Candidatus Neomarinimicrobiota bacterium]
MKLLSNGIILIVLILSGIGKIIDPLPAIQLMEKLPLIPNILILPIASILPALELSLALGILLRYKKFIIYSVNLLLFLSFFILSIYGTILKIKVDCGCFGSLLESRVGWTMVLRNSVFLGLSIYLFINSNMELINKIFFKARRMENEA